MPTRTRRIVGDQMTTPVPPPNPPERFTPAMPDDGRELMIQWEIPPEDWQNLTVKTARFKPGTQQLEILFSCLPNQWYLETVAQKYGPGSYRIQAGPGPHRQKNTTVTISREYAQESGYEPAPPMPQQVALPDAGQQLAARTFVQATQGAVDPLSLAQMVSAAVETALAKQKPAESGLDSFLKGFTIANELSLKAMDQAKAMLGMPSGDRETREIGWPEVIMQMGPTILGTLQQAMATTQATPPRQELATKEATPPPKAEPTRTQEETMYPTPPPETVPLLQIMKNYAPILVANINNPAIAPEQIAEQVAGLLGPDLDNAVIATAQHVAQFGPMILGHAAPEMVSQKAVSVLIRWAEIINGEVGEPEAQE